MPIHFSERHDARTALPAGDRHGLDRRRASMRHVVRSRRWFAAALLLVIALAACTPTPDDRADDEAGDGADDRREGTPAESRSPAERITWPEPDPSRPVVDLTFLVADDLRSVGGTERIAFTPDLDICELVFRLWPNKPFTAVFGNRLDVTEVVVGGRVVESTEFTAGAPEDVPGTLLEVPLPSCVDAGTTVQAELDFVLTLGEGTDERIGTASEAEAAWFGTAFPMLAWERGRGWARDPAEAVAGEMATSETFRLRTLDVVAPSRYQVLGTGTLQDIEDLDADDLRRHRFRAAATRDVTVTVGVLQVYSREVDGHRVHVGAPAGSTRAPLRDWAIQVERSIRSVADRLGPLPYDDVWVSVLPDQTDGIEFPGAMQFGDLEPDEHAWLITHEVAHLWFHGLVGNNQARDPWLDEAFATFIQLVEAPEASQYVPEDLFGEVGRPMSYWATFDRSTREYVREVYRKGGTALAEARRRGDTDAFDEALIDYLVQNAHAIAVPADVEAAFAEQPEVLQVLRRAGALERTSS
jgi:hypothetical protein